MLPNPLFLWSDLLPSDFYLSTLARCVKWSPSMALMTSSSLPAPPIPTRRALSVSVLKGTLHETRQTERCDKFSRRELLAHIIRCQTLHLNLNLSFARRELTQHTSLCLLDRVVTVYGDRGCCFISSRRPRPECPAAHKQQRSLSVSIVRF